MTTRPGQRAAADTAELPGLAADEPVPYLLTDAAWQVLASSCPSTDLPPLPALMFSETGSTP